MSLQTNELISFTSRYSSRLVFVFLLSIFAGCSGGSSDSSGGGGNSGGSDLSLAGGDTTSDDRTSLAFENPASNLSSEEEALHAIGDRNFASIFVAAPATINPGLGPIFNNNSCESCHTKNGRGQPIFGQSSQGSQALIRISSNNGPESFPGGPRLVPGYGIQFQDHAIFGSSPEGRVNLSWSTVRGTYGDGTSYELRKPQISLSFAKGNPGPVQISMRNAPPIFGTGLLEAIPDSEILKNEDPNDADGDGISGRANYVWDIVKQGTSLGRFGRKANTPSLLQQSATAYAEDMGVANPLFPNADGSTDITEEIVKSVEFYSQTLAVPRNTIERSTVSKAGYELFKQTGCESCHVSQMRTGAHPVDAVANQSITPFTDLLLHDMGSELADGRQDFLANGNEWKTAPLWGVGVTATILSRTANFLHDGRARTLEEAILWHGGEAERAKETFRNMSASDRALLIEFLKAL